MRYLVSSLGRLRVSENVESLGGGGWGVKKDQIKVCEVASRKFRV